MKDQEKIKHVKNILTFVNEYCKKEKINSSDSLDIYINGLSIFMEVCGVEKEVAKTLLDEVYKQYEPRSEILTIFKTLNELVDLCNNNMKKEEKKDSPPEKDVKDYVSDLLRKIGKD